MESIRMAHINARSLTSNFLQFHDYVQINNFDIIAVTETWLNDEINSNHVSIHNYQFIRKDRNTRGGGVGFYVKTQFKYSMIEMECSDYYEDLWIKISSKNKMDISEDERRAADNVVDTKTISLHQPIQVGTGRKIALASTYHKEGQILVPRIAASFISKEEKEKEEREREEYGQSKPHHYYGGYRPPHYSAGPRVGIPGLFGGHRPDPGEIYAHSGYGSTGLGYGHSGGGYLYPTPPTGLDSGGFMKKFGLKGLLLPLAGIAILGAAAALTANPVLLQLGTLHGRRRRRRSATKLASNSSVYPVNPRLRPDNT
ncbi:hypothetical protein PPYR_07510 [Photinus pyralis]|uniref:RNA-directed DNA polymerase from mobile element jockey n=1 Tax=Photinus pyralis TaxID=7054 RepID=A0A5N4AQM3_PHOPY|nr:hypothetical protein PPYR_07510 [Photinus pyralis]